MFYERPSTTYYVDFTGGNPEATYAEVLHNKLMLDVAVARREERQREFYRKFIGRHGIFDQMDRRMKENVR